MRKRESRKLTDDSGSTNGMPSLFDSPLPQQEVKALATARRTGLPHPLGKSKERKQNRKGCIAKRIPAQ